MRPGTSPTRHEAAVREPSTVAAQGFSMSELLIAMVIGLSLAVGVIQVYVGTSQTERDQEARARMQENGRYAVNLLASELRMAGYRRGSCSHHRRRLG
jgi:prepilin-type N-terminal cleavage/methylation domain-containing protein